jgi:predicted secreted protein
MSTRALGRLAFGCFLLLSACASVTPASQGNGGSPALNGQPVPNAQATRTPSGARFRVKGQESFSVVFPGNPATGYEWFVKEGHDKQVVTLIGQRRGAPPAVMMPGAPMADEIFDFKAQKPGETVLTFALYRSWEGPKQAIDTVSFPVSVASE